MKENGAGEPRKRNTKDAEIENTFSHPARRIRENDKSSLSSTRANGRVSLMSREVLLRMRQRSLERTNFNVKIIPLRRGPIRRGPGTRSSLETS